MRLPALPASLFRSSSFCCCIPVRAGFVAISLLTFLLAGAVSVIIWFEISHSQLSSRERVAFVLTGVVQGLLFLASVIGFVGAVARKQLFVTIYAYFLYVHLALNLVVGIYFLVTVFVNTSMESSCSNLMSVSTYVFIAIVAALLLLELYGVLIVTRYVYRLRTEKRDNRSRRLGYFHALSKPETQSTRHTRQESDNIELLHPQESTADRWDVENARVFDIRPQSYMPVSTYDREPSPVLARTPPASPPFSDTSSGRRIRALPPRPATMPVVPQASDPAQEGVAPRSLPNPHKLSSHPRKRRERSETLDGEDERRSLHSVEVSTTTHSALMDHAFYMGSLFSDPPPVPSVPR